MNRKLEVGLTLTAKDAGASAAISTVETAQRKLNAENANAARAAETARDASTELAAVQKKLTTDVSAAVQAVQKATTANASLTVAVGQQQPVLQITSRGWANLGSAITAAAKEQVKAQREVDRALARGRASYTQFGFQIQDITSTLALGINPFVVLGQQAGQTAAALSGFGGVVGRVAGFLSGPFGSAIIGAVTVFGLMASRSGDAKKALEGQEDAINSLADASEALKKIQQGAAQSQLEELSRLTSITQAKLKEALATREQTKARLEAARSKYETDKIQASGGLSGQRGENAGLAASNSSVQIGQLDAEIRKQDAAIQDSLKQLRTAQIPGLLDNAAAATDKAKKATLEYTRALDILQAKFRDGKIRGGQEEFEDRAAGLARQRDKALAAAAAEKAAPRKALVAESKAARAQKVEEAKEAREALKLTREQDQAYAQLLEKVDPLAAAQNRFNETLAELASLRGRLTNRQYLTGVDQATAALDAVRAETLGLSAELKKQIEANPIKIPVTADDLRSEFDKTWDEFGARGATEITALAQLLGGKLGGKVEKIFAVLQGLQTGNFTAVGGKIGGLLTLLNRNGDAAKLSRGGVGGYGGGVIGGFKEAADEWKKLFDGMLSSLDRIFKKLPGDLGKTLGGILANAEFGKGVTDILGVKGSRTGAALGSVAGSIAEKFGVPFGKQIGAVLGSVLGGALKAIPKATSTISTGNGGVSAGGATGSKSLLSSVNSLGRGAADSLESIAEQLSGRIADGLTLGSLGQRKNKFTYDPTGRGKTRKKDGALQFESADEAQAAFLADAISDGAIGGLSPKVTAALRGYADNLNKGVAEALKVQNLERLLAAQGNPFASLFDDFERQAAERNKVARKYGFDLEEIERLNGAERVKNLKAIQDQYTGSLQKTVDQLRRQASGGTVLDQLGTLGTQREAAIAAVRGGDLDQLGKVTDLTNELAQLRADAFGSTGQFASGAANDARLLQQLIDEVNLRISGSADEARTRIGGESSGVAQTNTLLNEQTDILSQQATWLQQIAANTAGGVSAGTAAFPNVNFAQLFARGYGLS
jgi:hypothetical protein